MAGGDGGDTAGGIAWERAAAGLVGLERVIVEGVTLEGMIQWWVAVDPIEGREKNFVNRRKTG